MLTTLLLAAAVSTTPALDVPWKAVATSGTVDARTSGATASDWRKLVRGDGLAASSDVRTGRRGRATLTDRASILMIDPGSEVQLPPAGAPPRVVQAKGSVVYEVDGSKVHGFEVVTPFLVAGVKGTVFLVTVQERRAAVTVDRGVVAVRRDGSDETIDVHAGETAVFDADTSEGIQIIREEAKGGSGPASDFAEREQRKLDDRRAESTGVLGLDLHAEEGLAATDALVDGATSLLDRDTGVVGDVVDTITDPVSDVLGPILDPQSSSTGGGILDPLTHLLQELTREKP